MAQQQVGCGGARLGGLCVGLWHLVWSGHAHPGGLEGVGVEAPSSSDTLDALPSHRDPWSPGLVFSRPLLLSFALPPGESTPRADTGCAGPSLPPPRQGGWGFPKALPTSSRSWGRHARLPWGCRTSAPVADAKAVGCSLLLASGSHRAGRRAGSRTSWARGQCPCVSDAHPHPPRGC